jgi:hypothetical protein
MEVKTYATPKAFMIALNARLKAEAARSGRAAWRVQQLAIFERLLARIAVEFADAIVLKGGLVLELRLARARATKDVDVRFTGIADSILPRLQHAGRLDLHDFMTFEVDVDKDHSEILAEEAKYGGKRFRVICKIAGQKYGAPFGLDIGIGDPMIHEPEEMTMPDRLEFIGVAPPRLRVYPIETHIAEKLHAYTKPRDRPNSRDKDLPDIALISTIAVPSAATLRAALDQTFGFRATHAVPAALPRPPEFWHALYLQKLEDYGLEWPTLEACYERACQFINPVLAGLQESAWDPVSLEWHESALRNHRLRRRRRVPERLDLLLQRRRIDHPFGIDHDSRATLEIDLDRFHAFESSDLVRDPLHARIASHATDGDLHPHDLRLAAASHQRQHGAQQHRRQTRSHQNLPESESPACPRPPQGDTAISYFL